MELPDSLLLAVEQALGSRIETREPLTGGFTPQLVFRLGLDDGGTAILKAAPPPDRYPEERIPWSSLLDREVRVYRELPFLRTWQPELYASGRCRDGDEGEWVWLLIEDLGPRSGPRWTDASVDAVARALAGVHRAVGDHERLPAWLRAEPGGPPPHYERIRRRDQVAGDLPSFATSAPWWDWWERAATRGVTALNELYRQPPSSVNHVDVRGDNIFLRGGRAVFVDWAFARMSYPALDSVYWALGLQVDGYRPAPVAHERYRALDPAATDDAVRGAVSFFAAYFVDHLQRAAAPPPVQALRRRYLVPTLRWYAAALDLPPPPVDQGEG